MDGKHKTSTAGKVESGIVPKTNCNGKKLTRNSNNPLTKEEAIKLISATEELEAQTLFILGINTGMRVSEIVNIPWTAINWAEGSIRIWDEKKNKFRDVYPDKNTLNSLKRWQGSDGGKREKVFQMSAKTVENRLQYWTQKILNRKKSWHCLRHTYITLNVIADTPVPIIMDNTGDSAVTIYRYYTQIPPQKKREFIERAAIFSEEIK